ncbi:MAG: hypothetical protein ACO3CL_08185 [Bacteroidia bacterium]
MVPQVNLFQGDRIEGFPGLELLGGSFPPAQVDNHPDHHLTLANQKPLNPKGFHRLLRDQTHDAPIPSFLKTRGIARLSTGLQGIPASQPVLPCEPSRFLTAPLMTY